MKIPVNGIRINVADVGGGEPTLVFLHYWGGSARTWADVIALLSNQHRCVALDHRGWGESDAPAEGYGIADLANDAQAVIGALKLNRYVIVGHSMGAKTAQLLASRRPVGLVGLVLVGSPVPGPMPIPEEQRKAIVHVYDSRESIITALDQRLTALPLTEEQRERVVEDSLRGSPAAKRGWPLQGMVEDIRTQVRRINVPTLVLSGERDEVDPSPTLQKELLPLISGARLQLVPRAGHLPMLEAPDAVAAAIRSFVADIAAFHVET